MERNELENHAKKLGYASDKSKGTRMIRNVKVTSILYEVRDLSGLTRITSFKYRIMDRIWIIWYFRNFISTLLELLEHGKGS